MNLIPYGGHASEGTSYVTLFLHNYDFCIGPNLYSARTVCCLVRCTRVCLFCCPCVWLQYHMGAENICAHQSMHVADKHFATKCDVHVGRYPRCSVYPMCSNAQVFMNVLTGLCCHLFSRSRVCGVQSPCCHCLLGQSEQPQRLGIITRHWQLPPMEAWAP